MTVQVRLENTVVPFVLFGSPLAELDAIIAQDAGRSIPLAPNTVMTKIAASQKWVSLEDVTAVDGTAIPYGIYVGSAIPAADIVAGDIADAQIIVGSGITVDASQLVLENSYTLATIIGAGLTQATIGDYLANVGIYSEGTVAITEQENT